MHSYHLLKDAAILPIKPNIFIRGEENYCQFYLRNLNQGIDLFDFADELPNVFCRQQPGETRYYRTSTEKCDKATGCILVKISIHPERTIKSTFDLILASADKLLRFSKGGFDDWLPADEQTEELLRLHQQQTNQLHECNEREMLPLDEGFAEFEDEEKAAEAEMAKQIEAMQVMKDAISKIGKMDEKMPRKELEKLREAYERVFRENANLKQYRKGVLTIVLPAVELVSELQHALEHAHTPGKLPVRLEILKSILMSPNVTNFFHTVSDYTGSSWLSTAADYASNPVVRENIQRSLQIAGILYHIYSINKSIRAILQTWNVLKNEQEVFREILASKGKAMHMKLAEIDEHLDLLCKILAKPSPFWNSVIGCIETLVARISDLDAMVMSVICVLHDQTQTLNSEEGKMKAVKYASIAGAGMALLTAAYGSVFCEKKMSDFKIGMLLASAVSSALLAKFSNDAINAIRVAIASQVKVKTSIRTLHEFLDESKSKSKLVLLKLQSDQLEDSEKGQLGELFTEMKCQIEGMDDMIKGLVEGGDDSEKYKKDN